MTGAQRLTRVLGGRWYGRYGLAYCPAHPNTKTPALSLRDGDDGKLLVYCHTGCDGANVLAALRARGLLEGRSNWKPDPREIERRKADEDADLRRRIDQASRCWTEARPIVGTLAERYLRTRGITCDLPLALRYHPKCWHGPTASKVPAMVAAVVVDRVLVGVHRTYLAEPGVKAFDNAKLMLGRCAGGAVQLSGGPGPLLVAEGVETALCLLSALPGANPRVWAALSTSGMVGLILPPDPGELVLAPDGDAPGRAAANKLADRACAAGWRVRIMKCREGADWNDISSEVAA
jgi:hypothetical protein